MKKRLPYIFIITISGMLISGCCSMRNNTTQIVEITSTPSGATARIQPTGVEIVTPDDVLLKRKTANYTVTFKKEGYEPAKVQLVRKTSGLWRDCVWLNYPPVGIIGIIVDTSTGTAYQLQPQKIDVKLVPVQDAVKPKKIAPAVKPST